MSEIILQEKRQKSGMLAQEQGNSPAKAEIIAG
jgi:hypothetical protein